MYVEDVAIARGELLQGDIIVGVQSLGGVNLRGIRYLTEMSGEKTGWNVSQKPAIQPSMILSHSCEIDPKNGNKSATIILSPIRDVLKIGKRVESVEALVARIRAANKIETAKETIDDSVGGFLKFFYVDPHPLLGFDLGGIVDFSLCYSVSKDSYDALLANKKLQLDEETVTDMSLKLAAFFHRG